MCLPVQGTRRCWGVQPVTASPVPQLREGTAATIGPQTLRAEDEDSPAAEVTFSIQPPANGKVVLRSAPNTALRSFTQAQIDSGIVLFVHQGTAVPMLRAAGVGAVPRSCTRVGSALCPSSVLSAGPLDGGFAFDLWDGENLSPGHFFLVRAHRQEHISLAKKQSLTLCPGECVAWGSSTQETQRRNADAHPDVFSRCPAAHHQ